MWLALTQRLKPPSETRGGGESGLLSLPSTPDPAPLLPQPGQLRLYLLQSYGILSTWYMIYCLNWYSLGVSGGNYCQSRRDTRGHWDLPAKYVVILFLLECKSKKKYFNLFIFHWGFSFVDFLSYSCGFSELENKCWAILGGRKRSLYFLEDNHTGSLALSLIMVWVVELPTSPLQPSLLIGIVKWDNITHQKSLRLPWRKSSVIAKKKKCFWMAYGVDHCHSHRLIIVAVTITITFYSKGA